MPDDLAPLVYLLAVLLPLLVRGIAKVLEALAGVGKDRPAPRRPAAGGGTARQAQREGEEQWKRLLRGESVAPPPESQPAVPSGPPAPAPPRPAPRKEVPSGLDSLEPGIDPLAPSPPSAARPARGAREEAVRPRSSREGLLKTAAAFTEATPAPPSPLQGSLHFPPRTPAEWRRAVALHELLAPPLVLREGPRPGDLPPFSFPP